MAELVDAGSLRGNSRCWSRGHHPTIPPKSFLPLPMCTTLIWKGHTQTHNYDNKLCKKTASIRTLGPPNFSSLPSALYPAHTLRALRLLPADGAPTVGWGKTFWRVGRFFFTKTALTRKQKVKKSIRRCQIDRLAEDFNWTTDEICGPIAKTEFPRQNPNFWVKKHTLLNGHHVLATTRQNVQRKKYHFPK